MTFHLIHRGNGKTIEQEVPAFVDHSVAVPRTSQKLNGVAAFYARKTSFEREALRLNRRKPYSPGSLLDLEPDACRYTINDENSHMCGAKCNGGSSWCPAHHATVYPNARHK